jgi:corrinoid protein of di/trimethylamine methyltransferase
VLHASVREDKSLSSTQTHEKLRSALLSFDVDLVRRTAQDVVASGVDPLQAVSATTKAMQEVGQKFANSEIFLADLMIAGDCMKSGMDVLLPMIPKGRISALGNVAIGTVRGDIHDIGKTIVITMLTASGFEVRDLGTDLAVSKFAEEAMKTNPDIVAASAIMTTTMPVMKDLVEYFQAIGIRTKYKILIGGGPVTQEYADLIGADGYAPDAVQGADVARKLVSK